MPIDAPNPYGSYFDFDMMRSMIEGAPGTPVGFDRNQSKALGLGGGGFPNTAEMASQRAFEQRHAAAMSHALQSDARANTLSNFVTGQLYPDKAKRDRFVGMVGGQVTANEVVAAMLNMPGVNQYIGGDIRSVRLGADAIVGSGAGINAGGQFQRMYGGGLVQNAVAEHLFSAMNRRFWGSSGAAQTGMTSGLDRNQIGAIMMTGAVQGAFSGLDLGSISRSGDTLKYTLNDQSFKKIEDFVKTAAKTLSSLADIFGNRSGGELLQLAQGITGLDTRQMKLAGQRIASMKATANVFGVDPTMMMETAMTAEKFGKSLGISGVGGLSAERAAMVYQSRRGELSFFRPTPTMQETAFSMVRDQAAMLRDPIGARIQATEMMIQTGQIGSASADAVRGRASGLTPEGLSDFDAYIRGVSGGMDPKTMIRAYGSGANINAALGAEGQQYAATAVTANMRRRALGRVANLATRFGSNAANVTGLFDMFSQTELDSMSQAFDKGQFGAVTKMINGVEGADARSAFAGLLALKGTHGSAYSGTQNMIRALSSDPYAAHLLSRSDAAKLLKESSAVQAFQFAPGTGIGGSWTNNITEGFLATLGKDTVQHKIGSLWMVDQSKVRHGGAVLDPKVYAGLSAEQQGKLWEDTRAVLPLELKKAMGLTGITDAVTARDRALRVWNDPEAQKKALSEAGYYGVGLPASPLLPYGGLAFASTDLADNAGQLLKEKHVLEYASRYGSGVAKSLYGGRMAGGARADRFVSTRNWEAIARSVTGEMSPDMLTALSTESPAFGTAVLDNLTLTEQKLSAKAKAGELSAEELKQQMDVMEKIHAVKKAGIADSPGRFIGTLELRPGPGLTIQVNSKR